MARTNVTNARTGDIRRKKAGCPSEMHTIHVLRASTTAASVMEGPPFVRTEILGRQDQSPSGPEHIRKREQRCRKEPAQLSIVAQLIRRRSFVNTICSAPRKELSHAHHFPGHAVRRSQRSCVNSR